MAQFKEIRRGGYLPDLIARQVMDQISAGELQPGDLLPTETALADLFGVSRNVVREAIARLRSDGVINTKQGRGAVVNPPSARATFRVDMAALTSKDNLADLFELRGLLEIDAAGIAAQRRSPSDLEALTTALDHMRARPSFDEQLIEADAEFHRCLATATGNSYLATIVDYLSSRLKETTRATRDVYGQGDLLDVTITEHERVLEAVATQDQKAARQAMALHIDGATRRLGVVTGEK
ncbi:HTH-type transcriptional regulator LutR [Pelagimonas phthalicica]|uniref:HTH-type transcriptional regulator LutR n=1 Tax=Pelagimonas phthalicica TaxID=1037362 RepID=A0A238JHK9_9RHOB|nr:FadR/GntR family transcriptional regulator [Pelagimonas phthalicica]TDS92245.1 GntR family transcriptional regulator [Pelagimonas phthalicica]SMX29306.1 HTH-type transcriptional regulator LutR [Pelagimonas phthalicica]